MKLFVNNPEKILISVCVITFNHSRYISQALKGIISQKGDFTIEIIVGDDCSTDNTEELVKSFQVGIPENFVLRYNRRSENLGMRENFITTLKECSGKYIALCEGDDFWIDSMKLIKQVSFLENNKDFSACFHNAVVVNQDSVEIKKSFSSDLGNRIFTFDDVIDKWVIPTCSLIFRNFIFNNSKHPFLLSKYFYSDRPLEAFLAKMGKIYCIDEHLACYRIHENGITNKGDNSKMCFEGAIACKKMIEFFPESSKQLNNQIVRWSLWASEHALRKLHVINFVRFNFFALCHIRSFNAFKSYVKFTLMIFLGRRIHV